jgi:DNA replication and repair protein RecF
LINKSESKFKDFIGLLNVIIFVPEDLDLLKGNPKVRRKLLDIELSKLSSLYLLNLSHYYHLLKQRNNYLKMKKIDEIVIKTLNQQLAFYGEQIFTERNKFIDELSLLVEKFYQIISETDDKIKIEYQSNIYKDKLTFLDNLEKSYQRDLLLQQTNVGVHRDDFIVYLNEKNASNYASQGELRSIVLAFKLALVEYIYLKIKEYPLLLLDDVMSELDTKRQQNLIKYLNKKVQTFITTTSIDNLENEIVDGASLFYIDDGNVREEII